MIPNIRPSSASEEEGLCIWKKTIMKASQWKQRERKEINICSILRDSWGIEIVTHTFLVNILEGRKKTLDSSCLIKISRIPWMPTRHSKKVKKLCSTPYSQN